MDIVLPESLQAVLVFAEQYKYPLVFLGSLLEGPLVMIAAGFLYHQGVFSLLPLFLALMIGDLIADVGWYFIGYYFAEPVIRRHGHLLGISTENLEKAKDLFRKYHARILLLSKVTMGFGLALATLMAAGATRVPFRIYLLINTLAEPIFVAIMLAGGYFFARFYVLVADGFKIGFIVASTVLVVTFVYAFSKYMKSRVF